MNYPSLQSLRTALIAGVRRPDVLADLLDDGEQLAVLAGVEAPGHHWGGEVGGAGHQVTLEASGHRLAVQLSDVLVQLLRCFPCDDLSRLYRRPTLEL